MQKIPINLDCYTLDKILATALKAFYLAEGVLYLQDNNLADCEQKEWLNWRCFLTISLVLKMPTDVESIFNPTMQNCVPYLEKNV